MYCQCKLPQMFSYFKKKEEKKAALQHNLVIPLSSGNIIENKNWPNLQMQNISTHYLFTTDNWCQLENICYPPQSR